MSFIGYKRDHRKS